MAKGASKTNDKLTAGNLKEALWDTLQKVRKGEMDAGNADAIATQGREIVRTVNLQLRVAQQSKRPIPTDVMNFSENV
jgi:hypothetical protein